MVFNKIPAKSCLYLLSCFMPFSQHEFQAIEKKHLISMRSLHYGRMIPLLMKANLQRIFSSFIRLFLIIIESLLCLQ